MQSALTKPDTGAVPDKEFEPGQPPVSEGEGAAVAGRATECVLNVLREAIDAGTHIDRFNDQPDLVWGRDHGRCHRTSASQGALPDGSSMRQPPGLWRRMRLPVVAVPTTLTGTSVSDGLAAASASFSLRSQR